MMNDTALLSNKDNFTIFSCKGRNIRFRTSPHLEKYTKVLEWDNGYLVVLAKYEHNPQAEEEYIDLVPILKNLYLQPEDFLKSIKDVRIRNA